ncbi:hypothetical protein EBBID32_24380 [Sphingobium indicum BiD32]|uniref:Uncharacterized protein n=1 Tax=Sphingobium indicum BiD32 TaxID=1301087 RepID=N1MRN7_9SPHN|nr:hypothetical protein EBBID32_24380 [Sphingobium indicum BiD32]
MHAHPLVGDPCSDLAKIDLKLMPGTSLKANRRALLRLQLPPPGLNPKLDRSQPNYDPVLARQLLTHDVGVTAVPKEPLAKPVLQSVKRRFARRLAERRGAASTKIASDCVACAAELLRKPLRSPAKLMQPQHCGHLVCLKHLISLHRPRPCRKLWNPIRHLSLLSAIRGGSSPFR